MKELNPKKYYAELIGTFALVLIGCGSVVIAGKYIGNSGNIVCLWINSVGYGVFNWKYLRLSHQSCNQRGYARGP